MYQSRAMLYKYTDADPTKRYDTVQVEHQQENRMVNVFANDYCDKYLPEYLLVVEEE